MLKYRKRLHFLDKGGPGRRQIFSAPLQLKKIVKGREYMNRLKLITAIATFTLALPAVSQDLGKLADAVDTKKATEAVDTQKMTEAVSGGDIDYTKAMDSVDTKKAVDAVDMDKVKEAMAAPK